MLHLPNKRVDFENTNKNKEKNPKNFPDFQKGSKCRQIADIRYEAAHESRWRQEIDLDF